MEHAWQKRQATKKVNVTPNKINSLHLLIRLDSRRLNETQNAMLILRNGTTAFT
jgi:hypothetical protein